MITISLLYLIYLSTSPEGKTCTKSTLWSSPTRGQTRACETSPRTAPRPPSCGSCWFCFAGRTEWVALRYRVLMVQQGGKHYTSGLAVKLTEKQLISSFYMTLIALYLLPPANSWIWYCRAAAPEPVQRGKAWQPGSDADWLQRGPGPCHGALCCWRRPSHRHCDPLQCRELEGGPGQIHIAAIGREEEGAWHHLPYDWLSKPARMTSLHKHSFQHHLWKCYFLIPFRRFPLEV